MNELKCKNVQGHIRSLLCVHSVCLYQYDIEKSHLLDMMYNILLLLFKIYISLVWW